MDDPSPPPHPKPNDDSHYSSSEDTNSPASISPTEITVAICCALPIESVAVRYTLDEEFHCRPPRSHPRQHRYVFSYGRIGEHKVVLA
ncbi:uncharacterized protein BP01DRAFT_359526 [Aspergillus saccharolyticus JOP 1030-1]|uniref:Uncharacterized protein n=1 Tax=Aspergillus saccharolyticus JOP 1030-1 TaxID=1450539 RepID=A0A318ZQ42_9EURO|nr:hypothetical protein BP01DRAFT_359526 [Aspergillus saccharolyticus JOP 1030-1]PYH42238.1 hypothetical protein BP01DRAFT_359526 [Aspergillus saccharolyticus JOP 1030-1]